MTRDEFRHQTKKLEAHFKWNYSSEALELMYSRLKHYTQDALQDAVHKLMEEEEKLPLIPKVTAALRSIASQPKHKKVSPVVVNCPLCEDTGIRLRRYRKDFAKDFYCVCLAADAIEPKHDWTAEPWASLLAMPPGAKRLEAIRQQAAKIQKEKFA